MKLVPNQTFIPLIGQICYYGKWLVKIVAISGFIALVRTGQSAIVVDFSELREIS